MSAPVRDAVIDGDNDDGLVFTEQEALGLKGKRERVAVNT